MECPYCKKELEPSPDQYEPDTPHEEECHQCEKSFIFYIEYYPTYTTIKAPCLNGGEHNYQDINGYPTEYYDGRVRCSYCENETVKDKNTFDN
jgi:hypothetical protein